MQGTHARVEYGDTDSIVIENGNSGYNRVDLIVARYEKVDGIESVEFAVIKGTPSSGTAVQPSYTAGNILEGAELAEVPVYAVALAGVNVISVTSQLPVLTTTMANTYTKAQVDAKDTAITDYVNAKDAAMSARVIAAQNTADAGFANAHAAQHTADVGVAKADAAQASADTAARAAAAADAKAVAATNRLAANVTTFHSFDVGNIVSNPTLSDVANRLDDLCTTLSTIFSAVQ